MKILITKKQYDLMLRFTIIQQNLGLTPALAKVNSLLTISDSDKLTFDQIRDTLDLSKSTTSNALNRLLKMGIIRFEKNIDDNKRYFYSHFENWAYVIIKEKFPSLSPEIIENTSKYVFENDDSAKSDFEILISHIMNKKIVS